MADDTGFNDLGYKNTIVSTPNLDMLANGGVKLTNHHAFKVCGPSRSAFHTGRLPWQMGYYDNSGEAVPWLKTNAEKFAVSKSFRLVPELLAEKGFVAHAVGKWHLGHCLRSYTPTYRGYNSWLGYYNAMTEDYWLHTHTAANHCPGPVQGSSAGGLWPDLSNNTGTDFALSSDNSTYESTMFGNRSVEIVRQHSAENTARLKAGAKEKPLFLYLAFHNEHDPHQAPRDAIDEFPHIQSDTYKVTAAQLATMDVQVGRLLQALNESGMLDNTVVSFTSDNGGPLDHANNFPLRGGKHTFYEGGVRTEAFIWSPLLPKALQGTEYAGLMHLADWRATYAEGLAGMTSAEIGALDKGPFGDESKNMWSAMLAGLPSPRSTLIHQVHSEKYYPGNCTINTWQGRNCPEAITVGDLKYMKGFVGDPRRLELNETGTEDVEFGHSGGKCGLSGFQGRCDAPGRKGTPTPRPDDPGGCLHGCLFNLTADPAEEHNVISHSKHAAALAHMQQLLDSAGALAPPWLEAEA